MSFYQDKVVWITGASSGIGEATVYAMANAGAKLVISARRSEELQKVATRSGLDSSRILIVPMDVTEYDQFDLTVKKVKDFFGRIDILFNNAGISQRSFVIDTDISVYKKLLEVDLISVIALTKAVLPIMITQKSGNIAVTSSIAGKVSTPGRSGYAAAKFGLHGFFDALRAEVYKDNIGVNIICPGYINTELSKSALSGDGSNYNKMDQNQANGLSVEKCAAQILRAIEKNKAEAYIGGRETLGVYLQRFFPAILRKIVINQAPK